jgi:hypothetical protein
MYSGNRNNPFSLPGKRAGGLVCPRKWRHFMPLLAVSCIALFGCPSPSRSPIKWANYDFSSGLGEPVPASIRGFSTLPIEGATYCNDLCVQDSAGGTTMWASTRGPVVYSTDNGACWKVLDIEAAPVNFQKYLDFSNIKQIRIDTDGHIWMAHPHWLAVSADNGAEWEYVFPFPGGQLPGITSMEVSEGSLWMGCETGLVVRVDISRHTYEETCRTGECITCILPLPGSAVLIGTQSGIFKSPDAGRTFTRIASLPNVSSLDMIDGSIWCRSGGILAQLDAAGAVLWQSSSLTNSSVISVARQGSVLWCLASGASGAELLRVETTGPSISTRPLGGSSVGGRICMDGAGILYVALPGKVAVSPDGELWDEHPFGISTVKEIRASEGHAWAGLEGGGLASFRSGAQSWVSTYGYGDTVWAMCSENPLELYFASGMTAYATKDGGATVSAYSYGAWPSGGTTPRPLQLVKAASGRYYLLADFSDPNSSSYSVRLYYSDDDCVSWSAPDTVYAGSQYPRCARFALLEDRSLAFVTTDFGVFLKALPAGSWTLVEGLGRSYDCCAHDGGVLSILGNGWKGTGIYTLGRGENSWTYESVPDCYEDSRLVVDGDGSWWLAAHTGLYYRRDALSQWEVSTKADGLASNHLYAISVEGTGTARAIWVGTSTGASRGTF